MAAERDCEACYMAEYMAGFLGRTFTGTISGMSDFGVYVELPNTAEGMVRRESLPEEELTFDGRRRFVTRSAVPVTRWGRR